MALADYLRPGFPVANSTDTATGNVYSYRGPTASIDGGAPAVGDTWADGIPVVSVTKFELRGNGTTSEMTVVTSKNVPYSGTLGTPAAEEVAYELEWRPVVKPLEVHPDFITGGTYALDATGRRCIIGWRAEQDPSLRAAYKFRQLNSDGVAGDEVDIFSVSPNAWAFIRLAEVGVEEFVDYMPVWRKRSMYRGSVAPSTGAIGVMTTTPSGSGYPTGYEWVKSKDSAQRVGRSSKWRRDEEWEGAIKVYADKVQVFLPA